MNKVICECCGNQDLDKFKELNYSKISSMNYPKILDDTNILFCTNCSFSFNNTKIDPDILNLYYSKYYNGKASKSFYNVNKEFVTKLFNDDRSISQLNLLSNFINFSDKNILDIGSGICVFFLQINNKYPNSNLKKYIIEKQISNKDWYNQNDIHILNFDILENIPNQYYGFFDLITMSHSLEHFQNYDLQNIFSNISLLLKKKGKLFIEVPNANLIEYQDAEENMEPHLSFFTKKSLNYLSKRYQFKTLFLNTFGRSQKNKIKNPDIKNYKKNFFYLNKDNINIHLNAEIILKKNILKQKRTNKILNILSKFITRKFLLYLIDLYILLKNKNFVNFDNREFILNEDDGEYIRIILEKE